MRQREGFYWRKIFYRKPQFELLTVFTQFWLILCHSAKHATAWKFWPSKKTVVVDFVVSLSKATAVIFRLCFFAILLDITRPGVCEVRSVAVNRHLKETFANSAPKPKAELINNSVSCSVLAATTKHRYLQRFRF